jgi:hypothetical protein
MAYLLSEDTAKWIDGQRRRHDNTATPRRGWIEGRSGGDGAQVAMITGGDALSGYSARVYASMAELMRDTTGTGGKARVVYPVETGLGTVLPSGTVILVHSVEVAVTGGSENTHTDVDDDEDEGQ